MYCIYFRVLLGNDANIGQKVIIGGDNKHQCKAYICPSAHFYVCIVHISLQLHIEYVFALGACTTVHFVLLSG